MWARSGLTRPVVVDIHPGDGPILANFGPDRQQMVAIRQSRYDTAPRHMEIPASTLEAMSTYAGTPDPSPC